MSKFCKSCGEPLSADARFCKGCGTAVGPSSTGSTPAPTANQSNQNQAQISFPERLRYIAEDRKSMRLLVGTFSMSGERPRTLYKGTSQQRSFPEYQITFRWFENGKEQGDFPITTGTMDPRQITQGNQIALLVVDIPKSQGLVAEYKNYAANRADGETIPFAIWAPDGAEGRYLIEREKFYLDPWAQTKRSNKMVWILLGTILVASIIIAVVFPCVTCFLPFLMAPAAFAMKKYIKFLSGDQVSYGEYFTIIQNWMNQLSSDGTIQRRFLSAFGITERSDAGRL